MSLYTLKTNDLTQRSIFIKCMLYKMYVLGVLINDLACLFNHKCLILLDVSLYTLRVNDRTRWTACINSMLYWIYIYILGVCMNFLNCLVNYRCLILLRMSLYTLKQMILLTYKYHGILVYIFYDCMNDINSIVKCKCDMLIDKSLYTMKSERSCPFINFWTTVYYIWCINCVFAWMITPSCQS